jgi:hypothetical protein
MKSVPPDQKPAIDDNIQRTVEKTALRKVRKVLDEIGAEEAADRGLRHLAYWIGGAVLLVSILFVAGLVR